MQDVHHHDRHASLGEDLVNTYGWVSGTEWLTEEGVRDLAEGHGIDPSGPVTESDLARLRAVRVLLREAFTSEDEEAVVVMLNDVLAETHPVPMLARDGDGGWGMRYRVADGTVADRLVAGAAIGLLLEVAEHGLGRLSVCGADDCLDVMVDTSRNHSKRYCSADVCGNRATTRAYRARKAAAGD
jgi:predicted RNA-binding Zn ribbon-like protein